MSERAICLAAVPFLIFSFFAEAKEQNTLALVGGKIYPSASASSISNGVILIRNGKIVEVGSKEKVAIPERATILSCEGMFLVAAFQNSHVHFTEAKWENASSKSAGVLNAQFEEMLLRYGFTTVVDTGSFLENTLALRARVDLGELKGPRILTAGGPLYPPDGVPYYVKQSLPPTLLPMLSTPETPEKAVSVVLERIKKGADVIKLFTGSWVNRGEVKPMPLEIATAAASEAHRHSRLVFSHASNVSGLEIALEAKVDILAHALDDDRGITPSHFSRMKAGKMAMIPTLKLFHGPDYFKYILKEVADFSAAGGQILFGTDVGYLTDYDPTQDYVLLAETGLNWQQILTSLTTAPAERFQEAAKRGQIAPGMDADIVILAADPAANVRAFSNVHYTLRGGNILFSGSGKSTR